MILIYVNCSVFVYEILKIAKNNVCYIYYETNRYNRHFNYIIKL